METTYLSEYVSVADCGSFTGAAGRLHLTQSTLSKHVAALEREFGAELFVRDRSGIRLTEAGKLLYAQAVKMERVLQQTRQLLSATCEDSRASDVALASTDARCNPELRCKCRRCASQFGLDDREVGALILYLEEWGIDVIAKELGTTRDQVADVLGGVYRKLGVAGKQEALDCIHAVSE